MTPSEKFLQLFNEQEVNFNITNGNLFAVEINLNVRFKPGSGTFKAESRGKFVLESQDINEFAAGVDEIFSLTKEAWEKRWKEAPHFTN